MDLLSITTLVPCAVPDVLCGIVHNRAPQRGLFSPQRHKMPTTMRCLLRIPYCWWTRARAVGWHTSTSWNKSIRLTKSKAKFKATRRWTCPYDNHTSYRALTSRNADRSWTKTRDRAPLGRLAFSWDNLLRALNTGQTTWPWPPTEAKVR